MVIPDSVIEQLKGLVEKWKREADYEDYKSAGPHIRALRDCAADLNTLLSTLLAAPRDQGEETTHPPQDTKALEAALQALRKVPLFGITDDALGWRCAGCGHVSGIHPDGRDREEPCLPDCYVNAVEKAMHLLEAALASCRGAQEAAHTAPRDQGEETALPPQGTGEMQALREALTRVVRYARHSASCRGTGCSSEGCGHSATAHHNGLVDGACLHCRCVKYTPYAPCECGFTALRAEVAALTRSHGDAQEPTRTSSRDQGDAQEMTCLKCRGAIRLSEVYRCADCDAPFHQLCLRAHFGEQAWPKSEIDHLKLLRQLVPSLREALSDLVDACYVEGSSSSWKLCGVCDTEHLREASYGLADVHSKNCAVLAAERALSQYLRAAFRSPEGTALVNVPTNGTSYEDPATWASGAEGTEKGR
jgi:hypothetical protein